MNIIDYLKTNHKTFAEEPFNRVDSLVLSQLFYARIEVVPAGCGISQESSDMTIKDFCQAEYFAQMFSDDITDPQNEELYLRASANRRFRDIEVREIEAETSASDEKQFAAAIFKIDDQTDFVCFRGTDGAMLAWKEDFNLSFMNEVPSQREAVEYINRHYGQGSLGANRRMYVGGHSKGGNLAIYSALMCEREIHDRIDAVISLDGPGFREDVMDKLNAIIEADKVRIIKLVPQSSIVGMLMESQPGYQVVKADASGIMQHSAYTWQLVDSDFEYLDDLSFSGEYTDRTIRKWLENISDQEREVFVDTIFQLLSDNDIHTTGELKKLNPRKVLSMISSYKGISEETKHVFQSVLMEFGKMAVLSIPPSKK